MMNQRNYQRELEQILQKTDNKGKTLFLHSCCAPCSSYVLVYLRKFFRITVFYYNPNITLPEEYQRRVEEQKRLIETLNKELDTLPKEECDAYPIQVQVGNYEPERFFAAVKGYEQIPEGGERCFRCFTLRLREAAKLAAQNGSDYFTTTLTISPLKNAAKLNEIGEAAGAEYHVEFLPSDFKKKNGYKTSVELSQKYHLYRQDYCGCVFSKKERDSRNEKNT